MNTKDLKELFDNNSNGYIQRYTMSGEFSEKAITFDVFEKLVKNLTIPRVVKEKRSETPVCPTCNGLG